MFLLASHAFPNARFCGEVDYGLHFLDFASHCRLIGVTGTNGKSTVTRMLSTIGRVDGIGLEAGNIGTPLLSHATEWRIEADTIAIELSSYQLDLMRPPFARMLDGSIIVNTKPDHLDRYASYEDYLKSKAHLLECCAADAVIILPPDGDDIYPYLPFSAKQAIVPHVSTTRRFDSSLEQSNWNVATTMMQHLGVTEATCRRAREKFKPLPHRFECLASAAGPLFIDDSKATNAAASEAALDAASAYQRDIIILLGGVPKNEPYEGLFDKIKQYDARIVVFGDAAELFVQAASTYDVEVTGRYTSLAETLEHITPRLSTSDLLLLSPACASFDEFKNYQKRGEYFKQWVVDYRRSQHEQPKAS